VIGKDTVNLDFIMDHGVDEVWPIGEGKEELPTKYLGIHPTSKLLRRPFMLSSKKSSNRFQPILNLKRAECSNLGNFLSPRGLKNS
jgi:hypothetical protein